MNEDQLDLIVNNSDWNEEKRQWTIPNFVYRERFVSLPKLQSGKELSEEKEKKEVIFRNSRKEIYDKREESFKMNQIVRDARQSNDYPNNINMPPKSNSAYNRAQLTPIKNDSIEKIKTMNMFVDERKRKV